MLSAGSNWHPGPAPVLTCGIDLTTDTCSPIQPIKCSLMCCQSVSCPEKNNTSVFLANRDLNSITRFQSKGLHISSKKIGTGTSRT